jgi:hypothetical protein
MKKLLAAAAIALAPFGVGVSTAHADPTADARFVSDLAQHGFNISAGPGGLVTAR